MEQITTYNSQCITPPRFLLINAAPLTQSRCIGTPPLTEQIELHRDCMWRRDEDLSVESAVDAERFIEDVAPSSLVSNAVEAIPYCHTGRHEQELIAAKLHEQKIDENIWSHWLEEPVPMEELTHQSSSFKSALTIL